MLCFDTPSSRAIFATPRPASICLIPSIISASVRPLFDTSSSAWSRSRPTMKSYSAMCRLRGADQYHDSRIRINSAMAPTPPTDKCRSMSTPSAGSWVEGTLRELAWFSPDLVSFSKNEGCHLALPGTTGRLRVRKGDLISLAAGLHRFRTQPTEKLARLNSALAKLQSSLG